MITRRSLPVQLLLWAALLSSFPSITIAARASSLKPSNHTSNHAVIVSSSRFWFNYRHAINALAIYDLIRSQGDGIPDENIVLMLADDMITNPRNPLKNEMHYDTAKHTSLVDTATMQIDYRGDDVTVDNLRRVLLGKGEHGKRVLQTDANSNVLVYWTGHGGDSFFKFQDVEEITSTDIARLFQDMEFQQLLFLADTCQAFTLGNAIDTVPGVYMLGSSLKGENSYAHHSDSDLGLSVIERYTFQFIEFLKHVGANAMRTVSIQQAMVDHFDYQQQRAHVGVKRTEGTKPLSQVLLSDFFGNAAGGGGSTQKSTAGSVELLDKPSTNNATDWSAWKAMSA
mmetsp:Transcript_16620/g.27547  ORF Transcript_16620/g.27547 Transcript_16620/m.27547 type:complete len:341 (-) Transcript_16620:94-1116(-)